MKCFRLITAIMIAYVFLASLFEIGYNIYEMVTFMQSPIQYYATCSNPPNCTQFTMLTQSYRKQLYPGISKDMQSLYSYSKNKSYTTPNQTCFRKNDNNPQKLLTPISKIITIVFQSISTLILIFSTIRQYIIYLKSKSACILWILTFKKPSFLILFMIDVVIVPFIALMSVNFTYQCIENNMVINLFHSVNFIIIAPYVAVGLFIIVIVSGRTCKKQDLKNVAYATIFFSLILIIASYISLVQNDPIPIVAILSIMQAFELLLGVCCCFEAEAEKIQSQYHLEPNPENIQSANNIV